MPPPAGGPGGPPPPGASSTTSGGPSGTVAAGVSSCPPGMLKQGNFTCGCPPPMVVNATGYGCVDPAGGGTSGGGTGP